MGLDSIAYVVAAESLVDGRGLELPFAPALSPTDRVHMAHWAPGTSLILALPIAFGVDAIDAVRVVLGAAAFALVALATFVAGALERRAAPLVAILLLGSAPVWHLYTSLWSESLFLILLVAIASLIAKRPDEHLEHGMAAGASVVMRHAGLSLALACATWAASRRRSPRERIIAVLQALAPALVVHVGCRCSRGRRTWPCGGTSSTGSTTARSPPCG
jgi:hypothetical protein